MQGGFFFTLAFNNNYFKENVFIRFEKYSIMGVIQMLIRIIAEILFR